jgi:hypothetical protein
MWHGPGAVPLLLSAVLPLGQHLLVGRAGRVAAEAVVERAAQLRQAEVVPAANVGSVQKRAV